jgi:hypothetical protein
VLLQDCACGEPILDNVRTCPKCGRANPRYRHPRWRTFWPEIDSQAGADEAITLGYWAAFGAAVLGAITSLIAMFGAGPTGLIDAVVFALCGLGIMRRWRTAAVLALLLLVANLVLAGGIGVVTFFILLGLVNGVRGTFLWRKLSRMPRPEVFD